MTGHFHVLATPIPFNLHCFSVGCPGSKFRKPLVVGTPAFGAMWLNAPVLVMRDDTFWQLPAMERLNELAVALEVELEWEAATIFRLTERQAQALFQGYDLEDMGLTPLHKLRRV